MKLHASGEDYLEAILILHKQRGTVRSVDVARHLDVSKPSVSHAVTTLRDGGFLTMDEDYFLHLTDIGREVAEQIYEKHRFFTERLIAAGVDPETAERDACRIEHVISDESTRSRVFEGGHVPGMSVNSAERGLPAMAGRLLLIDNSTKHTERVRDLVSRTRLEVYTSGSAQDAIRQMLVHTFDVIELHTAVEGGRPSLYLPSGPAPRPNTLLLLYPVPTRRGPRLLLPAGASDLCLPEDYPVECAAGIEALLRRPWAGAWDAGQRPPALVVHGDLVIDPLRRRVTMRGRDIDLTPAEYRLLYFLASNPGIVFSKDYLYARVWGEERAYGAGQRCQLYLLPA